MANICTNGFAKLFEKCILELYFERVMVDFSDDENAFSYIARAIPAKSTVTKYLSK